MVSPKRRKGGGIVRTEELMPHPMAHFAPLLTDRTAAGLIGFDPGSRDHRRRAREALERLDDDNVIDLVGCGRGRLRIFGPRAS